MSRRFPIGTVLALAVLIGAALAGGGWWYWTSRPAYRLLQGQRAARSGDLRAAERYAEMLQADQRRSETALLRGEILFRQGQHNAALRWLKEVPVEESDLHLQAAVVSAQVYLAVKEPRLAAATLAYVLDKRPEFVDAHRWMAALLYDQGDVMHAIPYLREIARLDRADYRPLRLIGVIYRDLDDMDVAIEAYEEALRRQPPASVREEIRVEMAECLHKQFRDQEVLATLEGIESAAADLLRVEALIAIGRGSEADRLLDQAATRYPDSHALQRVKGERLRSAGDHAAAAAMFEKVIAADPYDHRAYYQLALIYEALQQPDKAARMSAKHQQLTKLLSEVDEKHTQAMNDPWNESVRWRLAELCDQLGRPKLAEMWRNAARACKSVDPR